MAVAIAVATAWVQIEIWFVRVLDELPNVSLHGWAGWLAELIHVFVRRHQVGHTLSPIFGARGLDTNFRPGHQCLASPGADFRREGLCLDLQAQIFSIANLCTASVMAVHVGGRAAAWRSCLVAQFAAI